MFRKQSAQLGTRMPYQYRLSCCPFNVPKKALKYNGTSRVQLVCGLPYRCSLLRVASWRAFTLLLDRLDHCQQLEVNLPYLGTISPISTGYSSFKYSSALNNSNVLMRCPPLHRLLLNPEQANTFTPALLFVNFVEIPQSSIILLKHAFSLAWTICFL